MDFDFLWVLNDKDIKVELLDKVAFLSTKPKTGLGRILRPFFMPRTSVICVLENSLVFALESAHSTILLPGLVDGIFIR